MNYTALYITLKPETEKEIASDILITELAEIGFESFVENNGGIEAYIDSSLFDETLLPAEYLNEFASEWKSAEIAPQNWNQAWEDNYEPVLVDDLVYVHAHFHPEKPEIKHQIKITPKMSFGTGHHATTELVMRHMLETEFKHKTLLDMGTGTGILAILAHQLGVESILATEIEDFALENCLENFNTNQVANYKLIDARAEQGPYGKFDLIIANITRNTLLALQDEIAESAKPGSTLIISGFYVPDRVDLEATFAKHGFLNPVLKEKNQWASIKFTKE